MKSKVTTLWDYTKYQLPAEYTRWRVHDDEIQHRLEAIAKSHAQEIDVNSVETYDSVVCRSESNAAQWNKENLLIFPGRGIAPAVLENAVLGTKVEDSVTANIDGMQINLTVLRIVRRQPMTIGDDMIALEQIEGVTTVADFIRWYRDTTEKERREKLIKGAAGHIQSLLLQNSQLEIDQKEAHAFCQDMVDCQFKSMGGMDNVSLVMLDEDVLNPTEAGVKKKLLEMRLESYPMYVLNTWIVEKMAGLDAETVCADGWKLISEMNSDLKTEDEVRQFAGDSLPKEFAIGNEASRFLEQYVEQFMEA
ncbi:MAG: hypothetical protein LUE20_04550 [Oscillospiraceae bacterium]|nr:hypothetical protein [Oscillospiraceae bacterium]